MKKAMGVVVLLGALFAVACGDKGGTTGGDSSSKPAGSSGAKADTGIPECDALVKKYDEMIDSMKKCMDKTPAAKAAMEPSIKTMEDSKKQMNDQMKEAAKDDASKKQLAETCKTTAAAMQPIPCPG